jgi:hypothetical protein
MLPYTQEMIKKKLLDKELIYLNANKGEETICAGYEKRVNGILFTDDYMRQLWLFDYSECGAIAAADIIIQYANKDYHFM